jgi:hypothetical protein
VRGETVVSVDPGAKSGVAGASAVGSGVPAVSCLSSFSRWTALVSPHAVPEKRGKSARIRQRGMRARFRILPTYPMLALWRCATAVLEHVWFCRSARIACTLLMDLVK